MSVLPPPPYDTDLVDTSRLITSVWSRWILTLITRIQQTPQTLKIVSLTAQNASIGTTAIPIGSQLAGLFFVSWYVRVTTAAGATSAVQVTIGHTDGGVSCAQSGTNLTGNTTSTFESGGPLLVRADQAIAPTYQITYASNPAGAMRYSAYFVLQGVS